MMFTVVSNGGILPPHGRCPRRQDFILRRIPTAKATDKFTVRDFRTDCLWELKTIKDA